MTSRRTPRAPFSCGRRTTTNSAKVLTSNNGVVHDANDEGLTIGGLTSDEVGRLAFDAGITVYELTHSARRSRRSSWTSPLARSNTAFAQRWRPYRAAAKLIASKFVGVGRVHARILGEIVSFVAFFIGQAIYSGVVPTASLSNGTVLRAVIFSGVYLTLLTSLGFCIGLIIRHSAASISVFVSMLLVLAT
jgi:hypothetical protein